MNRADRILCRTPVAGAIFPFSEDTAGLLFGGRSLRALQETEAKAAGFVVVDVDANLPLPDGARALVAADVVFSAATLQGLVDESASRNTPLRAAVRQGTPLHQASTRLTDNEGADLAVDLCAGDFAGKFANDVIASATVYVVADEDAAVTIDVRPAGPPPHQLRLANVDRLLGRATHWLHVLDLSLAALQTRLRGPHPKPRKRPQIHPTALVENSILGEGVRIEAGGSVIDSVIGDDVVIADHTVVHTSVIGDRCRTLVDTHLRRVVAMPGSTLSNLDMQDAIFGSEIFLTTAVAFFNDGPGRNVVVDGKDSGRAVLSGAIGTRTVLGSRALFRSGVAVPARVLVVARPGEALGRLDEAGLARTLSRLGDRARDV